MGGRDVGRSASPVYRRMRQIPPLRQQRRLLGEACVDPAPLVKVRERQRLLSLHLVLDRTRSDGQSARQLRETIEGSVTEPTAWEVVVSELGVTKSRCESTATQCSFLIASISTVRRPTNASSPPKKVDSPEKDIVRAALRTKLVAELARMRCTSVGEPARRSRCDRLAHRGWSCLAGAQHAFAPRFAIQLREAPYVSKLRSPDGLRCQGSEEDVREQACHIQRVEPALHSP